MSRPALVLVFITTIFALGSNGYAQTESVRALRFDADSLRHQPIFPKVRTMPLVSPKTPRISPSVPSHGKVSDYLEGILVGVESDIRNSSWDKAGATVRETMKFLVADDSSNWHLAPQLAQKIDSLQKVIVLHQKVVVQYLRAELPILRKKILHLAHLKQYEEISLLVPQVLACAGGAPKWLVEVLRRIPICERTIEEVKTLYRPEECSAFLQRTVEGMQPPSIGDEVVLYGKVVKAASRREFLLMVGWKLDGSPNIYSCTLPRCLKLPDLLWGPIEIVGIINGHVTYTDVTGTRRTLFNIKAQAFTTDIHESN